MRKKKKDTESYWKKEIITKQLRLVGFEEKRQLIKCSTLYSIMQNADKTDKHLGLLRQGLEQQSPSYCMQNQSTKCQQLLGSPATIPIFNSSCLLKLQNTSFLPAASPSSIMEERR